MRSQAEKAHAFRELHRRDGAFIIPNPWDVGSARLLARTGFEALATTSVGFAYSMGRRDHGITRDEMMAHAAALAAATDLPVSADLENGFGDDAETVADTIRMAAAAGLSGCSIEDSTNRDGDPIYSLEHATERIRAAAEVAQALPFPFMLTARSENYLHGRPDLDDTIRRLQAFQDAGADVLYAPGMTRTSDIATLVSAVDRPVNALAGMQGVHFDLDELSRIGVKRVSVGGALSRVALAAMLHAAREMKDHGTFTFVDEPISSREIGEMFDA
ncbi:MAG TPA: isocitrate lyase/phosphoenolpyruvate mutase family protein [Candidatus Elarobacter sp.]|nr:isocitrate lyase/phosphoenolpyruvate mutase family protein [Candidatus Elarobacter sp.]